MDSGDQLHFPAAFPWRKVPCTNTDPMVVQPVVKKLYRLKEMKENLYVIEEAIRKSS
jgi:hypothetical protein